MINWILAALLSFSLLISIAASAAPKATITMYSRPDCSYCQQMKPILYRLEREGKANVRIIQAGRYAVVPKIVISVNGKVIKSFTGFTDYGTLSRFL